LPRSLRLRPDRIVIGEVRDGSALDLSKAWNTSHPGGLATLHANSAAEGLSRLEDLIGEVTQRIPHGPLGKRSTWSFTSRVP
jgi:Flp pilus assembly CpaF family ATPase